MVTFNKLTRTYNAPLVAWIGANAAAASVIGGVAAAGIGAGASVYNQNKAADAAEDAAQQNAMIAAAKRQDSVNQSVQEQQNERDRGRGENATKNLANEEAFNAQMDSMNRAASAEKRAQDEARLLAMKDPNEEYAAKFKPGGDGFGDDSASDFLVPKVADDTGLVAKNSEAGLVTPLTFDV